MQVELSLWDTAGQERFHSLGPIYYRDAAAALIVFDITDIDSFERAKAWVKELYQMVGILCNMFKGLQQFFFGDRGATLHRNATHKCPRAVSRRANWACWWHTARDDLLAYLLCR